VTLQSNRLTELIKNEVSRQIFRNLMHELFIRLENTRKRVIVKRQLILLERLLNTDGKIEFLQLADSLRDTYAKRKIPLRAIVRDINRLQALGALRVEKKAEQYFVSVRLEWPSMITENEFLKSQQCPSPRPMGSFRPMRANGLPSPLPRSGQRLGWYPHGIYVGSLKEPDRRCP
jgi:hypothetical protein